MEVVRDIFKVKGNEILGEDGKVLAIVRKNQKPEQGYKWIATMTQKPFLVFKGETKKEATELFKRFALFGF